VLASVWQHAELHRYCSVAFTRDTSRRQQQR
jgi:hypothetical protein